MGFSKEDAEKAAEEIGVDWDKVDFNAAALVKGMDVELEHGTQFPDYDVTDDDPVLTAKIALAHLAEFADYYDRLAKMEEMGEEPEAEEEDAEADDTPEEKEAHTASGSPRFIKVAGNIFEIVGGLGDMTSAEREKEEIEAVFSLGGGELEDESWGGFKYWYDGVPSYAEGDFDDWALKEYHTGIGNYMGKGPSETYKNPIKDEDGEWEYQRHYTTSGETDCPVCGAGSDNVYLNEYYEEKYNVEDGADAPDKAECPLCETEKKDQPGVVYIGDGWAEVVFENVAVDEDEEEDAEEHDASVSPDFIMVDGHVYRKED